ncbi:MAG: DUF6807 family protein, partial [Verrucomicrobiota bacterium]
LFFAWTKLRFEGRTLDTWNQKKQQARFAPGAIRQTFSGPAAAGFVADLDLYDSTAPDGEKRMLTETWRVTVYGGAADHFLIDLELTQQPEASARLQVRKYHYGGMAIRGSDLWRSQHADAEFGFLTSEGRSRQDGNHTRPHWVDMHGKLNQRLTGVTIFSHPDNFRSPQPVRLHPKEPYFCFAPMVLGDFGFPEKKPYRLAYRIMVHQGKPDTERIERIWHHYQSPPTVRDLKP